MKFIKKISLLMMVMVFALALSVTSSAAAKKVTLNKTTLTLETGQKFTLKVNGTKSKVTWSSSNPKIASVSKKGVVQAVKQGKAVISAKVSKKTYKCKVTVKPKTLHFQNEAVKLEAGKSTGYTIPGASKLTYKCSSSNESVARLEPTDHASGKIVANGVGECVLTITYSDGSKAQCKVIVGKLLPTAVYLQLANEQGTYEPIPGDELHLKVEEKVKVAVAFGWPLSREALNQLPSSCKDSGKRFTLANGGSAVIHMTIKGDITAVAPGTTYVYAYSTGNESLQRAKIKVIVE